MRVNIQKQRTPAQCDAMNQHMAGKAKNEKTQAQTGSVPGQGIGILKRGTAGCWTRGR
jgi:hypothetical protein